MTRMQRRMERALRRVGETIIVDGVPVLAATALLPTERAADLVEPAQADSAVRPFGVAYLPFDAAVTEASVVAIDGQSVELLKVIPARLRGETVAQLVVLA
jgi:hypothetical protein